jgi:hypothetical protein
MNDLCPHCRVVRELEVRTTTVRKKGPRRKVATTVAKSYFCMTCGFFVRSKEMSMKVKAKA